MLIQKALERAKQQGKERAEQLRESGDSRSSAIMANSAPVEPDVPLRLTPLARIEFDLEKCAKSRVLVSDEQLAAAGHAAAAYRLMRGRALHRIKGGGWSCVGITSAGPGEGKTVTALNFAISIAREKLRTVYLLDLDMRNPSVLEALGCRPENQISQYFAGALMPDQVLYQTSVENLVIAGATEPVRGASELLANARLEELLKYIRRRSPGALILLDLPPVLSTDEVLVVAPRTDAVFLVVCEGVTRRDSLAKAVDVLSDFKVAGTILNRSSENLGSEYYGY
jgi:Mrp family chromosome partitioning ATPase